MQENINQVEYKTYINDSKYIAIEDHLLEDYLSSIANKAINSVLDTFEKEEKELIISRFGLNGQPIKTLYQLADEENISYEGIRKRERKILTKIKRTPSLRNQLNYLLNEKD